MFDWTISSLLTSDINSPPENWTPPTEPEIYNVLLLGSGGREHAIAKALKKSNKLNKLYVISTNTVNPGLTKLAHEIYCMKLFSPHYILTETTRRGRKSVPGIV